MQEKLKELALRYEDLQAQLADPSVYGDAERLKTVNRELKDLPPVAEAYQAYRQAEADRAAAEELLSALPGAYRGEGDGHVLRFSHAGGKGAVTVPRPEAQLEVGTLQPFLDAYVKEHGGSIDYIHGADVARDLAARPGNIAFLLPAMGKEQLFPTVIRDGVLPRKTFSMGEAHDKRFYLEARKIR